MCSTMKGDDRYCFSSLHINKHLGKDKKGWVSPQELMNIGVAIRNTKPYEKKAKEYMNTIMTTMYGLGQL
ncbi:MAG: hypothetical protein RBQ81_00920 [Arcobacteraceae bacterium]|nr:hypothetical protein [Arcobacteraceae bacterium]